MSKLILIIFFLSCTLSSFSQKADSTLRLNLDNLKILKSLPLPKSILFVFASKDICFCCKPRGDTSKSPLLILPDIAMTNFSKQLILNPKTINGIEFLKPVDALSKFGSNAKHGAFIFDIMEGVELFSLLDLFSYYSIKSEDQNLPVCLNNDFITDASKLLADITIIKSMKVVAGRYWFYTSRIDAPQRYINIATK